MAIDPYGTGRGPPRTWYRQGRVGERGPSYPGGERHKAGRIEALGEAGVERRVMRYAIVYLTNQVRMVATNFERGL